MSHLVPVLLSVLSYIASDTRHDTDTRFCLDDVETRDTFSIADSKSLVVATVRDGDWHWFGLISRLSVLECQRVRGSDRRQRRSGDPPLVRTFSWPWQPTGISQWYILGGGRSRGGSVLVFWLAWVAKLSIKASKVGYMYGRSVSRLVSL